MNSSSEKSETTPLESNGEMHFLDHLDELRKVLFQCLICFIAGMVVVGVALPFFADLLNWPLHFAMGQRSLNTLEGGLNTTGPMGVFSVIIQITFFGGFGLSLPFMLYFVSRFIAPALTHAEKKLIKPAIVSILILFLLGSAFSFSILVPSALRASLFFNDFFEYKILWRADAYYGLLIWMTLGVGLVFEFPLALLVLIHLHILQVSQLKQYRRHSIVAFLFVSAVITPTSDPITFLFLAAPLYALYEIAILLGRRIERRRVIDIQ
jgi:sec-independent protein translocase protein TatC